MRRLSGHAPAVLVACLGLIVGACNADASSSTSAHRTPGQHGGEGGTSGSSAPARDTFMGSIISGTGSYAHHHGAVKVYLHPRGSGQSRSLRMVIHGRCTGGSQCTDLEGTLTGRLVRSGHQLPDTGEHSTVTGNGQISPLGATRALGSVEGTGFIARGRESLSLTLHSGSGTVTIRAQTGPVGGFRSP